MSTWPSRHPVCVGAVVVDHGRVLLVRQAPGQSLAGQWSIPWGMVDEGEAPEAAALRETREEAEVEAEIVGLLGIQNLPQEGWLAIIFLCRAAECLPRPDGVETDQAAFFGLQELLEIKRDVESWCLWMAERVLNREYHLIGPLKDNPYAPRVAFL